LAGLFDALKKANPKNKAHWIHRRSVWNFGKQTDGNYRGGGGKYRNTGGFDMIQSGRTKIETPEQLATAKKTIEQTTEANRLDGLAVVGGDDSNTNAALLSEYFKNEGVKVSVIGVPKTIDGDLKNNEIEASFGFDTATKIYSELVGNICRDVLSAQKYWHFVRLMGRSASHITLEVALKTRPNLALIGEEVLAKKMTWLRWWIKLPRRWPVARKRKRTTALVLIPEGLIEFIPEMKELNSGLNDTWPPSEPRLAAVNSLKKNGTLWRGPCPRRWRPCSNRFPKVSRPN
jgi:pyrophosphate--fructose-6-phosphate 1-phosphotransferase